MMKVQLVIQVFHFNGLIYFSKYFSTKSEYSKPTLLLRLMGSEGVERGNHKENSSSISKNIVIRITTEKSVKGKIQ